MFKSFSRKAWLHFVLVGNLWFFVRPRHHVTASRFGTGPNVNGHQASFYGVQLAGMDICIDCVSLCLLRQVHRLSAVFSLSERHADTRGNNALTSAQDLSRKAVPLRVELLLLQLFAVYVAQANKWHCRLCVHQLSYKCESSDLGEVWTMPLMSPCACSDFLRFGLRSLTGQIHREPGSNFA